MMRQARPFVSAVLLLAALSGGARATAAPEKQVILVDQSNLDFEVTSFLVDVQGTFREWKGEVMLDRDDITRSSVSVTIAAKSIDTRIDKRNDHLRSADFLDVEKFPEITFKSRSIKKTGPATFDMVGDFTVHGVTKVVTIPVQIDRLQDNYSRFRGEVKLSRAAYNINYNSTLNPIEDEVRVKLVINLVKPPAAAR